MIKAILLVITSCMLGHGLVHDFHLSKTDFHYKSEQAALQITVHSFIDDMEDGLQAMDSLDYKLLQHSEHAKADSVIAEYFRQHLTIKINEEPVDFYFLGKEQSDDIEAVYSYLEIEQVPAISTLEIEYSLLTEIFSDQRNIVSVKADNVSKGTKMLSKKKVKEKFSF